MEKSYLKVVYSEDRKTTASNYPDRFAHYLSRRFDLKAGEKFLIFGCGRGDFLNAFKKTGLDTYGVDREIGTEVANDPKVKKVDLLEDKLPFADNTFDVVFHKSVIEHFYSPDKLMEETKRVLKPGGKLIFLTPDWISQMEVFYEDTTHCRPFVIDTARDLLAIWDFKEIYVEHFRGHHLVWRSHFWRGLARILTIFCTTLFARKITKWTGIQYFRWAVELQILAFAIK